MARCNCITRNELHEKRCAVMVAKQGISYNPPKVEEWKSGEKILVTRKSDSSSFHAIVTGPSRHGSSFIVVYHEKGFYLSVAKSMLSKP